MVDQKGKSSNWEAFVTITVHDQNHNPLASAVVNGMWSGDASGIVSGATSSSGTVTLGTGVLKGGSIATLQVTGVNHTDYYYEAGSNHDPDGDSDGTSITASLP